MIKRKGIQYWLEQKEQNTSVWKRFIDTWSDTDIKWKEICGRFNISQSTVLNLIKRGEIERRRKK